MGSDPPPEAFWVGNDLLDWCGREYGVQFNMKFEEGTDTAEAVIDHVSSCLL